MQIKELFRQLGPGIITASAAIGASHLVSSTQAGALFGWKLFGFIVLINLLKYPLMRAGVAYAFSTHDSLISGYARLGKPIIWAFWLIAIFTAISSVGGVMIFSAALLGKLLPFSVPIPALLVLLTVLTLAILIVGRYEALSLISKWIILILTLCTVLAFFVALYKGNYSAAQNAPSPWNLANLGFLVMLCGWMPTPMETPAITSFWIIEQSKSRPLQKKYVFLDYNLGFIISILIALMFAGLGALVMCGSGRIELNNGTLFTGQLVDIYAKTIGNWSRPLVTLVGFICIWGTTITIADGYARVLSNCQEHIFKQKKDDFQKWMYIWLIIECLFAVILNFWMKNEMFAMLKFAMVSAFLAAPILALFNYLLMTGKHVKPEDRYGLVLRIWSCFGLVFLTGFSLVFAWWYWIH